VGQLTRPRLDRVEDLGDLAFVLGQGRAFGEGVRHDQQLIGRQGADPHHAVGPNAFVLIVAQRQLDAFLLTLRQGALHPRENAAKGFILQLCGQADHHDHPIAENDH
jgi:hypothetical protein